MKRTNRPLNIIYFNTSEKGASGGQIILIDFDESRIIVINSIHTNYNWKKIAHVVIKN